MPQIKAAYPKFSGKQGSWLTAEHNMHLLVERRDANPEQFLQAAERFAVFVQAGGRSGPERVDLPSNFFSLDPHKAGWREEWIPPPTKAQVRLEGNVEIMKHFIAGTKP